MNKDIKVTERIAKELVRVGISVTTNAEFDTYEEAAINGIEFVLNNILK